MSAFALADLHLTENPRDAYRLATIKAVIKTIPSAVKTVILMGDLTEAKDRHNAWLTNQVADIVAMLVRLGYRVIILRGNHDYADADEGFFAFLRHIPGVEWIDMPVAMTVQGIGSCIFLPHTYDYLRDWDNYTVKDFERADCVFIHNAIKGALGDNGRPVAEIPVAVLGKNSRVVAGDLHKPQRIGPVTYVGAPYQVDFGDDFQPRALIIDRDNIKAFKIIGPQKVLIEAPSVKALLRDTSAHKGDIVKIRIDVRQEDREHWPAMRADALAWGEKKGLIVHLVQPTFIEGTKQKVRVRATAKKSDTDLMNTFGKSRDVADTTMRTGFKIAEEV